jgi:hypothetical protein
MERSPQHRRGLRPVVAGIGIALLAFASCTDFGLDPNAPEPSAASVAITAPAAPEVEVGSFVQFAAEVRDADGGVIAGAPLAWTSADTSVAGIDVTGRAVGRAVGQVEIRAASGPATSAPVVLAVRAASQTVASVHITAPADSTEVEVAATVSFVAEARDPNGDLVPAAAIDWSSSDEAIARIDASGIATGVAPGTARIQASSRGIDSAPLTLVVVAGAPSLARDVQPIFSRSCALSGCHAGPSPREGMSLEPGRSQEIIDRLSISGVHIDIVEPGDPQNSMLYHKIALCDAGCISGERMPPAPRARLSTAEIELIQAWIAAGARP